MLQYVILRDYTATWSWTSLVPESRTATTMQSYRIADDMLAWTGRLGCGSTAGGGTAGISCYDIVPGGGNPEGGTGCTISMGTSQNVAYHTYVMFMSNTNSRLFICNSPQQTSNGPNMNHRACMLVYTCFCVFVTRADFAAHCLKKISKAFLNSRFLTAVQGSGSNILKLWRCRFGAVQTD